MTTITLSNRSVRLPNAIYGVIVAFFLIGLSVGFLGLPVTDGAAIVDVGNLGAWERAYFLDGNRAPVLAGSSVNESITLLATVNARVAASVAPGADVIGNSERLMFGID